MTVALTNPRTYRRVRARGAHSAYLVYLRGRCIGAVATDQPGGMWTATAHPGGAVRDLFASRNTAAQWLEEESND